MKCMGSKPLSPIGKIANTVEKEYGQPFWDVVKHYADDGESISATAVILGYTHAAGLYKHLKANELLTWFKPTIETNGWKSAVKSRRYRNLTNGEMNALDAAREIYIKQRSVLAFGVMDTIAGHSRRHKISHKTVRYRVNVRGWSLEKSLTFSTSRLGNKTKNHPWRSIKAQRVIEERMA